MLCPVSYVSMQTQSSTEGFPEEADNLFVHRSYDTWTSFIKFTVVLYLPRPIGELRNGGNQETLQILMLFHC